MAEGLDDGQGMVFFRHKPPVFSSYLWVGLEVPRQRWSPFFLSDVDVKELGTWIHLAGTVVW